MNGKKSKMLRKIAKRITGGDTIDAKYEDTYARDYERRNFLVRRILVSNCTRAIYQGLK